MDSRREAEQLLSLCDGSARGALAMLSDEFNVLQARAQGLMTLAGVLVTVTGFSGRSIAGTSLAAQLCVTGGLALVVLSAVYLYARVMRIQWMTRELDGSPAVVILERIIRRRDDKTRAFAIGGAILSAGFLLYCVAVGLMLLAPTLFGGTPA